MMNLVFRVDADAGIGMGHLMRCLALAQGAQARGAHITFLSHCETIALRSRVEAAGFVFIPIEHSHPAPGDLPRTLDMLKELAANWVVLDNYYFDSAYQAAIRQAGYRLLAIDDVGHLAEYHADILLNQNIGAEKIRYRCDPDTRFLAGTRYVLLRPEFLPLEIAETNFSGRL